MCSEARVAGSAGADQTRDTDPIIGLGGDGDSIHSKASPLPLPSPATRAGTWDQCAGSVAHDLLTSEEAASMRITARLPAAWWWCWVGGSGQREDGRAGVALVGSEEPGHRVEPGVCPGLTCPREVDKAKAKGRVRVDRPIPRGVLEDEEQTASPRGGGAPARGSSLRSFSAQPSQAGSPCLSPKGRLTVN